MSDIDSLNAIIQQLDIEAFLNHLGISKNNKGKWVVDCPFCGGRQKLYINPSTTQWKCWRDTCNLTGNIITLYSQLNNCTNAQSVKVIKEFAGINDDFNNSQSKPKKRARKHRPAPPKVNENIPECSPGPDRSGGDGIPPQENLQDDLDSSLVLETKYAESGSGESSAICGAARPRDIYAELVNLAQLTEAHRNELRTKRGFTDALIDRLAFRSGGEYLIEVIEKLRAQFTDKDLKEAGILQLVNGQFVYPEQLLSDKPLIPYLDERGQVYYLRPHKYGFKDVEPQMYCYYLLKDHPEEIVLTEGEFKAAALYQLGIPAIGIPGISSFGKKHFERLIDTLKEFEIQRIIVIFDNEIKDNPAFSNFKEKPTERFDTDYWCYRMAQELAREGFMTRCGRLPDEWRQNGKIDFDGALAAGKTKEEIQKIILSAGTPKDFLDTIPDEGRLIVLKKYDHLFSKNPIERQFNTYVTLRNRGREGEYPDTISNFVINIKASYFTPEGIIRSIEFVNKFHEVSGPYLLAASEMAGLTEIKKFCLSKGNYIFSGTGSDLNDVWDLEFSRNIGSVIYMPESIGYIREHDLWLFATMAIQNGKVFTPDSDGIIWIKNRGFKPQSIKQNQFGQESEDTIPDLSTKPFDLLDLAQKLKQTVGGYEAYAALGWAIATIFSNDIFDQYKCTPILFPHGKRESGKSTFARWIVACFGVEVDGYGISESTQNSIMKSLAYFSSLGCWYDEYRNEPKVVQKDGYFRSAYNRQSSGKGTVTFQTKSYPVNAALLISGEELPKDNGLFTRLIPLQLSSYKRDRTHFNWLQRNFRKFSYLSYYLITHYDELRPKIMEAIEALKTKLLEIEISDRTAENWAIVAGSFYAVIAQDLEFIRWVGRTCQELKQTGENEHMLNQFLEDILHMVGDHELSTIHIYCESAKDTVYFNLWFGDIYSKWAQRYRMKTGREPFDEASIRKYLSDEPYFVPTKNKIKFSDIYKRGVQILAAKAPEPIAEAWEIIESRMDIKPFKPATIRKASNDD